MKRPAHATDCPACDGWIGGADLLCVQCTERVQKHMAYYYEDWMRYRANDAVAMEHYYRGLIIGSARALFEKRWHRTTAKTANPSGAEEEYRLTAKGRAFLDRKKGVAS